MNKILTTPEEINKNNKVLYAGNHYISLPEINVEYASVKSLNIVSLLNKGLVEISGNEALFKPLFYKNGEEVRINKIIVDTESYYIPSFQIFLSEGIWVKVKIYADLREKGFVYEFESSDTIDIHLICNISHLSFLRFNSHEIDFKKKIETAKWLGNPTVDILSSNISFAIAFGGEKNFEFERMENEKLILKLRCENKNAYYITLNSDTDGASTTLIHFRRKGYHRIYCELKDWLDGKHIKYCGDLKLEKRINENLFFNYFFAVGKDMESDRYISLTSRSPRYYVSGAFWERDSFLWSFPAIKLVDEELHMQLCREMILLHGKNAGDHAHYIDGTVLYPGFELDEAASYFTLIKNLNEIDDEILQTFELVLRRIEREYDKETGLYRTFLLPSDDPCEYPFVTIDNVILWNGLNHLMNLYRRLSMFHKADFLQKRIDGIYAGVYKFLVKEMNNKPIFVWSADANGNYRLYNDPPGNLGLMYYYGFIDYKDELFRNTINYYYTTKYKYYFEPEK